MGNREGETVMAKVWEYVKAGVNFYVDFVHDWPGFVSIAWPVTIVVAIWLF